MKKSKLKSRKETVEIVRSKGELIKSNEHRETLIQAAIRNELDELLSDREEYRWG